MRTVILIIGAILAISGIGIIGGKYLLGEADNNRVWQREVLPGEKYTSEEVQIEAMREPIADETVSDAKGSHIVDNVKDQQEEEVIEIAMQESVQIQNQDRDGAILAVQKTNAQKRCFGQNPTFYESRPEDVHVREEGGLTIIDNQILVTFTQGTSKEQVQKIIQEFGGDIVGCIAQKKLYQVQFRDVLPKDGEKFLAPLRAHANVRDARMYKVEDRNDNEI